MIVDPLTGGNIGPVFRERVRVRYRLQFPQSVRNYWRVVGGRRSRRNIENQHSKSDKDARSWWLTIKFIYSTHKIYQKLRSLLLSWWLFRRIDGLFSNFLLCEDNLKPSSASFSFRIFSIFIPSASNVTLLFREAKSLPTGVVLQFMISSSSF